MSKQSIYTYIKDNIVDGVLPQDFSLEPYNEDDHQVRFVDGAKDGIAIYHMDRSNLPDSLSLSFEKGVSQACANNYDAADATFSELGNKHFAIALIDALQSYIMDHREDIDAQALWAYATYLLFFANEKELVKIGLSLLELFGEPDENVKQVVRTLGLSNEFTLFSAWCARNWVNGNDELLELARNADGWGRIHVIEMLDPVTEEIRDWLFREGVNNSVMPEYSALTCYVKAGVAERLNYDMDHDEFSAITSIVHAVLNEGPVAGISALEDPKTELMRYVKQADNQPLDIWDCECINEVGGYAEDRNWMDLTAACNALLESNRVRDIVTEEVARGHGLDLACKLGIPYRDALLEAMRSDFDRLYYQCHWLMESPEHLSALLSLFRERIPLDSIEDDPRDEIGLGKEFDTYNKLDMLIQLLRHKMPIGLDYVLKTLTSPTVRNRTMSHRVLRCWVSDEGRPLSQLSPEAYERLLYAYNREPREDLRDAIKPLLDGETSFTEDMM